MLAIAATLILTKFLKTYKLLCLNTVLTVISLITLISNNISHLFNFSSSCNPLTIICLTSIFPIFRKFTHFLLQTKRKQPYLY